MPSRIFSRPDPDGFRASLRRAMPEPERRLWRVLRRRQLGVRFRRQHGIGPYVVDFYAAALKLVIELDGDSHFLDEAAVRNDAVRDRYLAGLGMRVIYNDLVEIDQEQRFGAQPVPVEGLFEQADVISVHVDGREENRHFVDERLLGRMRSDAVLINTSRGFVVDSAALAEFLKAHSGALALLDVHEPEPFGQDYPLLGLPNARLYPHLASRTQRAMENMSWVVRDVVRVLKGEVEGCGDAAG